MNGSIANSTGNIPHIAPTPQKEGFADVARWISLDPDNETFIYRRFNQLAARNLLYLQSELLALEKQLDELDKNDAFSDDMTLKDSARTWEILTELYENGNTEAKARMDLIVKMRAKLKEYYETMLLQSEILRLKRPHQRALDAYRNWFQKPYPALGGQAKTALDDAGDLTVLNMPPETDYLSTFLRLHWPARPELSRDGLQNIGVFNESSISRAVALITIFVAAIVLIGPVTSLYYVTNDAAKLGLVTGFTALFALCVGLMTNARRAEIFGATAAYAAVLVVFVSGNISNSSG